MKTFMGYLKSFINWLVVSSEDPTKMALTVKGLLVTAAPMILWAFGGFQFFQHMTPDLINTIINYVVLVVSDSLTVVGTCITIFATIRKIVNTFFIPPTPIVATVDAKVVTEAAPVNYPDPRIPILTPAPLTPAAPQA